eukprot:6192293-Pleurochrysis_carterae.AAC.2
MRRDKVNIVRAMKEPSRQGRASVEKWARQGSVPFTAAAGRAAVNGDLPSTKQKFKVHSCC